MSSLKSAIPILNQTDNRRVLTDDRAGSSESSSVMAQIRTGVPAAMIPQSEWLTAAEAAGYLKVRVRTLLLWARQGKVKGFALSGTKRRVWRFRQTDLDAVLLESTVLPSEVPPVLVKGIP